MMFRSRINRTAWRQPFGLVREQPAIVRIKNSQEPVTTALDVVLQNINAVNRGDSQNGVAFVFDLRLGVAFFNDAKFAGQNLGQKITVATGGFKEAGINAFGL